MRPYLRLALHLADRLLSAQNVYNIKLVQIGMPTRQNKHGNYAEECTRTNAEEFHLVVSKQSVLGERGLKIDFKAINSLAIRGKSWECDQ